MQASQNDSKRGRSRTLPVQRRGIEHRDAIIRAARQIFGQFGYQAATTRAIAAAAGMEQGHLAYYFKTKDHLWREVVDGFAAELERPLLEAGSDFDRQTVKDISRRTLGRFLRTFAANQGLTRLLLGEISVTSPRHDWLFENVGRRLWRAAKPLFEALEAYGYLRGTSPMIAYLNVMSGALLMFGCRQDIAQMAGDEAIGEPEDHVDSMLQALFGQIQVDAARHRR